MIITDGDVANDYAKDIDDAKDEAKKRGFDIIEPEPDLLLLDIDDEAGAMRFAAMLPFIDSVFGAKEEGRWSSRSGNTHITVRLNQGMRPSDRITLQAILGSDPRREALAIRYLAAGVGEPSFLTKPKADNE